MTFRHKLFCITFLSILSIPSNAQEASAKCPENTSKAVIAGGGGAAGCHLGHIHFPRGRNGNRMCHSKFGIVDMGKI
jgi:hypothetical protein